MKCLRFIMPALVLLAALLIQCIPQAPEHLQWDRARWEHEPWRVVTGHLCHWSWPHLGWDVSALVILSVVTSRLAPSRILATLVVSSLLITAEVTLLQTAFVTYRGLSGLDSALFGLGVAALWSLGPRHPASLWGSPRLLAAIAALGMAGKVGFELVTGTLLFAPEQPDLYSPVPSAHAVGFLCGVIIGFWPRPNHHVTHRKREKLRNPGNPPGHDNKAQNLAFRTGLLPGFCPSCRRHNST